MKIFKSGYTLAEVMIVLAVLGILASILLPAISKVRPNRDKMMFKKAYHVAERIVYELVNNDDLYPAKDGEYKGFDNIEDANYNGDVYSGNTKFCSLFAQHVNTTADITTCSDTAVVPAGAGTYTTPTFTTTDGIDWYMPISNFADTVSVYVDINSEKGPNCYSGADNCDKPDILSIKIKPDGKMFVDGTTEQNYLKSNTTVK